MPSYMSRLHGRVDRNFVEHDAEEGGRGRAFTGAWIETHIYSRSGPRRTPTSMKR